MRDTKEKKVRSEFNADKLNFRFNVIKFIVIVVGSVTAFSLMHKPESDQNMKLSDETINQNRAQLILDLYNNHDDPSEILLGLAIIKHSYRTEPNWIQQIQQLTVSKVLFKKTEQLRDIPQDNPNYMEIMKIVDEIERINDLKLEVELLMLVEIPAKEVISSKGITSVSYMRAPDYDFRISDRVKNEKILEDLDDKIQTYINELEKFDIHLDL